MQLKYSNYVAFSHFHGKAVNNSGLKISGKPYKQGISGQIKFYLITK